MPIQDKTVTISPIMLKITDYIRIKSDFHATKSLFTLWPYLMFLVLTLILVNMKDFGHLKTMIIPFLKACHNMFFHDIFFL